MVNGNFLSYTTSIRVNRSETKFWIDVSTPIKIFFHAKPRDDSQGLACVFPVPQDTSCGVPRSYDPDPDRRLSDSPGPMQSCLRPYAAGAE